ncbi:putative MFS monocarboxylate transporter [Hypoxylon sp. FL1284]|nr:putative MFS monocarboxylate transporter [Hypoxylon sp. FL1284]
MGNQEESTTSSRREREPNVALQHWLQILSTFIVYFNAWGTILTAGVFQTYYEQAILRGQSSSNISWIATASAFLTLSAGLVTGPLYDQGFYRTLLLSGTLLQVFGIMMLSLCTKYYQLFLCQAVCIGIGAGTAFTPSVAALGACVTNPSTRAKVMGLVACGSSVGGVVYPIMFRFLVPRIGFPWTVRSIGFVALGLDLFSCIVLAGPQSKPAGARRRFFDPSILTDLPFILLCVGSICSATAYYIPFIYLPLITEERIQSVGADFGFDLVAIVNGSSALGRLLGGLAAAQFGPTETTCVCLFLGSIMLFCWIVVDTVAGTIVWSVFWGIITGVLVALPGAMLPLFCPSLSVVGSRSGIYWAFVGLGILIGSPIGGAVHDSQSARSGRWQVQVFAGILMMAAAVVVVYPIIRLRRNVQAGHRAEVRQPGNGGRER